MRSAHRLAHAESLQEHDSAERTYNRLARTFAAQLEVFEHNRTVSERQGKVQNVISNGGQTIHQPVQTPALKKRVTSVGDPRGISEEC